MHLASESRATTGETANPPLIAKILELRQEQARLLGFASFADLVLADRMAKNGAAARSFVDDLSQRCRAPFERERRALLEFRRKLEGPNAPELERWDVGYYAEKQRQALYDFDSEQLRPYFPLEGVVGGLFETARRLYGVKVAPEHDARALAPRRARVRHVRRSRRARWRRFIPTSSRARASATAPG